MPLSTDTIDRIVANVLTQISTRTETVKPVEATQTPEPDKIEFSERVITAETLETVSPGATITVNERSIVTPAAKDLIRERKLIVSRSQSLMNSSTGGERTSIAVVQYTDGLKRVLSELNSTNKEMFGCPDDAASFAISELCRAGATNVLIFAQQTYRAACLANRNRKAKAVAIRDAGEVKLVRKQLRANVWCIDPSDRSFFELKNLMKVIDTQAKSNQR